MPPRAAAGPQAPERGGSSSPRPPVTFVELLRGLEACYSDVVTRADVLERENASLRRALTSPPSTVAPGDVAASRSSQAPLAAECPPPAPRRLAEEGLHGAPPVRSPVNFDLDDPAETSDLSEGGTRRSRDGSDSCPALLHDSSTIVGPASPRRSVKLGMTLSMSNSRCRLRPIWDHARVPRIDVHRRDQAGEIMGWTPSAMPVDTIEMEVRTYMQTVAEESQNTRSMRRSRRLLRSKAFLNVLPSADKSLQTLMRVSVLDPHGLPRLLWECVTAVLLIYDLAVTPLQLVLDGESPTVTVLDFFASALWTLDMVLSFRTGVYKRGKLVRSAREIAQAYVAGWLFADLMVLVPEWVVLTTGSLENVGVSPQAIRVMRLLRFMRLVRLIKAQKLTAQFLGKTLSMRLSLVIRFGVWVVGILTMVHLIACLWYRIGVATQGWTEVHGTEGLPWGWRYMLALNWAVQHLHGGSAVVPTTFAEACFAATTAPLCAVVLVLFTAFSAQMLNSHQRYLLEYHDTCVRTFVRRYQLQQWGLDGVLRSVAEEAMLKREQQHQESLVVKLLPVDIMKEIMVEVRGSKLAENSDIFVFLCGNFEPFVRQVCFDLEQEYIRDKLVLFHPQDACTAVRVLEFGQMTYLKEEVVQNSQEAKPRRRSFYVDPAGMDPYSERPEVGHIQVSVGTWISEAALYSTWKHVGTLLGIEDDGSVLCLPLAKFDAAARDHPEALMTVATYARQFLLFLNEDKQALSDIAGSLPVRFWSDECFQPAAGSKGDQAVPLPLSDALPSHLDRRVCIACVRLAQRIASDGLDERRPHHGFILIVGDRVALESCGGAGFNPFLGHSLCVVDASGRLDGEVFDILRRNAFNGDGAIVVDGSTGDVVAAGWFVKDLSLGGNSGGARTRSARAIAQQAGGCYVIKCSEDSAGELVLHMGEKAVKFIGLIAEEDDSVEAADAASGELPWLVDPGLDEVFAHHRL